MSPDAWTVLEEFLPEQQPPHEFGISDNGLAYLVALATEGIQQATR